MRQERRSPARRQRIQDCLVVRIGILLRHRPGHGDLTAVDAVHHISDINKLLTNIRDLNVQIRTQGIYGEKALELRDARNVALDQLSKYMHINVEYSMERIDQFTEVEKLTVTIANSKGPDGVSSAVGSSES